ncbi:hypothetical protein KC338_g255 [Hortaea werneckii]|nr:hypothetical protein KC338_g255 [Hortaea werneckii]
MSGSIRQCVIEGFTIKVGGSVSCALLTSDERTRMGCRVVPANFVQKPPSPFTDQLPSHAASVALHAPQAGIGRRFIFAANTECFFDGHCFLLSICGTGAHEEIANHSRHSASSQLIGATSTYSSESGSYGLRFQTRVLIPGQINIHKQAFRLPPNVLVLPAALLGTLNPSSWPACPGVAISMLASRPPSLPVVCDKVSCLADREFWSLRLAAYRKLSRMCTSAAFTASVEEDDELESTVGTVCVFSRDRQPSPEAGASNLQRARLQISGRGINCEDANQICSKIRDDHVLSSRIREGRVRMRSILASVSEVNGSLYVVIEEDELDLLSVMPWVRPDRAVLYLLLRGRHEAASIRAAIETTIRRLRRSSRQSSKSMDKLPLTLLLDS